MDTDIKKRCSYVKLALRHVCTHIHVNGLIHSSNCAPNGDTYARNSIRGIWAKGQAIIIVRIEKRMISLLCEAICSVKGTVFCLENDESKYTCAVTEGGGRRQRRIVRSKSDSEDYRVSR